MINKQIEALKMAIDWIEKETRSQYTYVDILQACKEALAEAEKQEDYPSKEEILNKIFDAVYTQYPKKEWQSLSYDEITQLKDDWGIDIDHWNDFARAIEQALRKKNETNN